MRRRYLFIALAAVLCVCALVGCKEDKPAVDSSALSESASETNTGKTVSLYDLRTAMCAADSSLPEMLYASSSDSDPDVLFANISDADYSKVDGFFVAYAADGTAYEIAVICSKDEADAAEMSASLTRHAAERAKTYSYYMPDQVPKAEAAEIFTYGKYSVLIMCDEKDAVKTAFKSFVG